MNYFQLRDDMAVRNRWNLGEITVPGMTEPQLEDGAYYKQDAVPSVSVTHAGQILDFSLTSFNVPIATLRIADVVRAIAGPDLQVVPVNVAGQPGMAALNVLRVVHCLDETRSEFIKWTQEDHRADLAGSYRQVTKLVLDRRRIPSDAHFFRVGDWDVAFIVSEQLKTALDRLCPIGAEFVNVTPDDSR